MPEQTEEKIKSSPYIKCTISDQLDAALKTIEEKIEIPKADVIRAALHEHIVSHYPAYLPKSQGEIMNDVKEKFYFEKFNQEFRQAEELKNQISYTEISIKRTKDDIKTNEIKYNTVAKKINEIDPKNKSEHKLQSEKSHLEDNLKHLRKILEDSEKQLENYKKGITDGASM